MRQKKHKPEEIVVKLKQVDVLMSQGHSVADAEKDLEGSCLEKLLSPARRRRGIDHVRRMCRRE
ncbi:hypothetical protein [Paracoccus chinensis]|uniref:Transposase n=1 Tax=Paracoccus chinensis TaxID=525640 RepID=A0A1G9LRD2_9RHOB|nr:hypothetical protein [Paracoccus chinensis]SDL64337.1 hypothetical protein SAMN04487971_11619 [Paracoccus chinensis]